MKNVLLLLSLISTSLFAQDSGWFETGATWTYQYKVNGIMQTETHIAEFTITEQTILNGQACAKMEAVGDDPNPLICNAAWPPYYLYESNDSIFYATYHDNTFRLAYNFGAQPGDTWEFVEPVEVYQDETAYTVTVNDISTIIVSGQELKQLTLNYQQVQGDSNSGGGGIKTVIEKIGATSFFIPFGFWNICEYHFMDSIRCYNDSEISYIAPSFSSCFLGVNDVQPEVKIGIYPNPAQDNFTIEATDNRIMEISIYTISGKCIYSKQVNNQKLEVNTSTFNSGLYLILVQTENGLAYKKLAVL